MDVGERGIRRLKPLLIVWVTAILVAGCGGSSSPTTSRSTTAAAASGSGHAVAQRVPEVRVPKLVGERFEPAAREVARAGLEEHSPGFTGTIGNPAYNGKCMRILTQAPPAGTQLPKGATVAIVFGVCPKAITNGPRRPRG